MPDFQNWLDELSKRTGASVEQSDLERLKTTNPGDDLERLMGAYETQYATRGASQTTGSGPDSSTLTAQGYGSGRGETADDQAPAVQRGPTQSVASQWAAQRGTGGAPGAAPWTPSGFPAAGPPPAVGAGASPFPDWYRDFLTKQQEATTANRAATQARADALSGQLNQRATQGLSVRRPGTPGYQPGGYQAGGYGGYQTGARVSNSAGLPMSPTAGGIAPQTTGYQAPAGLIPTEGIGNMPPPPPPGSAVAGPESTLMPGTVGPSGRVPAPGEVGMGSFDMGVGGGQGGENDVINMTGGQRGLGAGFDPNVDPNAHIWNQVDQYAAQSDRARRNYLSDLAEKSGPMANLQGEQRMTAERLGQDVGSFEANLVGREIQSKRDEIAQALQMSAGLLSADQTRGLQEQLALMDQAIKEQQIGLGYRGQDLDYTLGARGQDLGARGQDMGYDEFLRQLALDEWNSKQGWQYKWQTGL